jgi:uncharacterized protein YbaP (TraB family)
MAKILSIFSVLLFFNIGYSQILTDFSQVNGVAETKTEMANQKSGKERKYQGLLWEITGNGLKKPSYLYGTMHVSKKLAFRLSDTFYVALKNADMIALELNPDSWMDDMIRSNTFQGKKSYQQNNSFYNSFVLNLNDQKTLQYVLSKSHSFVNYMLYRKNAMDDNFEENTFLDLFIFQSGKKMKKKVIGLEDYMKVEELSARATMPVDREKEEQERKNKRNTYTERKKEGYFTIEDAYRKGDLDAIDSMTRVNESTNNYVRFMLNERNRLMVDRMDSLLKYQSLFTGVGAAHLAGDQGMINMLREKGYKVRAVNSKSGRTAERMKEKIEQTVVPLNYEVRYSPDSVFSVELPGKLYESYDEAGYSEFFYPEMANGAYYNIYRLNTYSPITGINKDSILSVLDNILYEAIPGKIIRKTSFVQQNINGLDITNLTRRGDYQRYKIFITPGEIVIFKMSGPDKFVLTNGDRFFNSIHFKESGSGPYFKRHDFEVYMPGIRDENFSSSFPESKSVFQAESINNSTYYLFMESDLNDFSCIEEDSFELDMLAYEFYDDLKFEAESKKHITRNGMPGTIFKLIPSKERDDQENEEYENMLASKQPVGNMYACVWLKGPRYFLMTTTEADSGKAMEYFFSFKLVIPELKKEQPIVFSDTSLHYKVMSSVLPDDYTNFGYLYSYYRSMNNSEKYDGRNDYREFTVPLKHEYVYLDYTKLNDYCSYKDTTELWKNRLDRLTDFKSMAIEKQKSGAEKGYYFLDFVLRDTASMRTIRGRVIAKKSSLYTFYQIGDTLNKSNPLMEELISSFETTEPFPGEDMFKPRGYLLFDAIKAKDSLKINEVVKHLTFIKFNDNDAPALLQLIENDGAYKKYIAEGSSGVRNILIEKAAELKDKSILPVFERMYMKAEDSSLVQLILLRAIAKQKTKESFRCVVKLMEQETPIADEYLIGNLFNAFRDSLQLSAEIIPDLIQYTRYPEYKDKVYGLLSMLVDSGFVKPEQYVKYKKEILLDAQAEIKRVLASEEQNKSDKLEMEINDDYSDNGYITTSSRSDNRYNDISSSYYTLNYAHLLLPFHKDPAVDKYFKRTYKSENTYISMKIDLLKVKKNIPVPDSNMLKYIQSDFDRQELYSKLEKMKRLDLFDSAYLNQEKIARALIYEDFTDVNNDSIAFLERNKVTVKGEAGYVYFFKRYNKPQECWYVDYIGVQPLDTSKFKFNCKMIRTGTRFGKDAEIKALIKDSMQDIRIYGRSRARRYRY